MSSAENHHSRNLTFIQDWRERRGERERGERERGERERGEREGGRCGNEAVFNKHSII